MNAREKAKEFLKSYEEAIKGIEAVSMQIEALRCSQTGGCIKYSDMPKASPNMADLSAYAAKLDNLEHKLEEKRKQAVETCERIISVINSLNDADEIKILTMRYINQCKWEEIDLLLPMSRKTIHRKHCNGLDAVALVLDNQKDKNVIFFEKLTLNDTK